MTFGDSIELPNTNTSILIFHVHSFNIWQGAILLFLHSVLWVSAPGGGGGTLWIFAKPSARQKLFLTWFQGESTYLELTGDLGCYVGRHVGKFLAGD